MKCGWRLCVCCVHGPREPLFTGGCVMLCSACVICFSGVAEAARWLMISRAWSGEYAWCWQEHRLLMNVSTCGACVRAVRDYSWAPRSGGLAHTSATRMQSLSRARQGSGSTRRLSTYLPKLILHSQLGVCERRCEWGGGDLPIQTRLAWGVPCKV